MRREQQARHEPRRTKMVGMGEISGAVVILSDQAPVNMDIADGRAVVGAAGGAPVGDVEARHVTNIIVVLGSSGGCLRAAAQGVV